MHIQIKKECKRSAACNMENIYQANIIVVKSLFMLPIESLILIQVN